MIDEKWKDTVALVKDKFKVLEEGRREMSDIPNAFVDFIIFDGPQGKIKLERASQPVVLDKKTTYSKLAGAANRVEYIYSDTERSNKFRAFRFNADQNDWEELKAEMFGT